MVLLVVLKPGRSVLYRFAHALTHTYISMDELQNFMDNMAMSVVTGGLNLRVPKDADTMLTITAQTKSIIIHVEHKKYLMPFYLLCLITSKSIMSNYVYL